MFARRVAFAWLLTAGLCLQAQDVAPSKEEQDNMLLAMRNFAADYMDKLPNFICQEVVSQYQAGKKPNHWKQGDTISLKLVFNNGREEHTLVAVNNQTVDPAHRAYRRPLTSEGEFGNTLNNVFNPESQTHFEWAGWEDVRNHHLAKFKYSIAQENSHLKLTFSDLASAVVPYGGAVWGDPSTGQVWRIVTDVQDIPKELRTRSSVTTIDYDAVAIGASTYLLPVSAVVLMATDTNYIRNEMMFEGYRKFEAESTITFGDGSSPPKQ